VSKHPLENFWLRPCLDSLTLAIWVDEDSSKLHEAIWITLIMIIDMLNAYCLLLLFSRTILFNFEKFLQIKGHHSSKVWWHFHTKEKILCFYSKTWPLVTLLILSTLTSLMWFQSLHPTTTTRSKAIKWRIKKIERKKIVDNEKAFCHWKLYLIVGTSNLVRRREWCSIRQASLKKTSHSDKWKKFLHNFSFWTLKSFCYFLRYTNNQSLSRSMSSDFYKKLN